MERHNLKKGTKINKAWVARKTDRRVTLVMDKARTLYKTSLKKGALSISGRSCGVSWKSVKGGILISAKTDSKNTPLLASTLGISVADLAKGKVYKVEGDTFISPTKGKA
jgi:hypothetical protein